ncbi:MAG: nucleotide sugar dehydrogenase, partial [Thermoplasmata archaeon]
MREYDLAHMSSVELTAEALQGYDAVVISTDHSSYDYHFIVENARLIVDSRNATKDVREHREKIVRC